MKKEAKNRGVGVAVGEVIAHPFLHLLALPHGHCHSSASDSNPIIHDHTRSRLGSDNAQTLKLPKDYLSDSLCISPPGS